MKKTISSNLLIIIFSSIYLLFSLLTFKDYGVGIEEHFQRSSGFNWLNYLLQFSNFENLKEIVDNKIIEIKEIYPNLPNLQVAPDYGIVFDLPAAFFESYFQIENIQNQFYFRHLASHLIFFISGLLFYKILNYRIPNKLICFLGFTIYLLTPRIYGNSFFDTKDLFFLSMLTTTVFFYFKYEKDKKVLNLLLFSLFCALSTSSRIVGLIIPFAYTIILFLKFLNKRDILKNFRNLILFLFSYLFFMYIHWPYIWTLDSQGLIDFFSVFHVGSNPKVFFNGIFYNSKDLPLSYLPLWISISTPIYTLILFLIGFLFQFRRVLNRMFKIEENTIFYDFWRGNNEKKDLFLFLILMQIVTIYLLFNLNLFSGWRHFYFLNFFLAYYSTFGIYIFYLLVRNKKPFIRFGLILFIIFTLEIVYKLHSYHPYQSVYFNNLASKNFKKKFEIDTQSLSRADAIKKIINDSLKKNEVIIGTASWTPLEDAKSMIPKNYWNKLIFSGTANMENADYIYTNYYYEVNNNLSKKYEIPLNFYLYKVVRVDNTLLYSIYKNKKLK